MAQYRKGRKSPWMVQYREDNRVLTRSFKTKSDAETFEDKIHRGRQLTKAGLEKPAELSLLLDFAADWLRKRAKDPEITRGTFNQDNSKLRTYWLPWFGTRPMSLLTSQEIEAKLDYLQYELNLAPATRNRHRALLHTMYRDALRKRLVVQNPMSSIPLVKETSNREKVALSVEEQEIYLAGLRLEGARFEILGELMLWTGGRICAANVLQWRDFDFDLGIVQLRRIEERASGTIQERQKGGADIVVPLVERLRYALLKWRDESRFTKPHDFVACQPQGHFICYDTFKGVHARVVEATKLRRFTPHDLKRTFATNAKRAGLTRADIRELFSHSSEAVTARYDLKDIDHLVNKVERVGFGAVTCQPGVSGLRLNPQDLHQQKEEIA